MENIKFELDAEESELARKFMEEHPVVCPNKDKYQGAVGVGFSFSFSATTLGQMATVRCHCGAHKFLSNP